MSSSDESSVEGYNEDDDSFLSEIDVEAMMRQALGEPFLEIYWDENYNGIFANVDSFLELSKGNTVVEVVYLDPYWNYNLIIRRSMEDFENKLGRALGNLQGLKSISIDGRIDHGDEHYPEEEPPNWESVGHVLCQVWQRITLDVCVWPFGPTSGSEEAFARAIHGHPAIQRFETCQSFLFGSFGIILCALATLAALESAVLTHDEMEEAERHPMHLENVPTLRHPEHMTTFLLSQSLRSVKFEHFYFPNSLCEAVARGLTTGSPITCLDLTCCDFPDGGATLIVHALQRNTTLKTLRMSCNSVDANNVGGALMAVLLVNKTLTELTIHTRRLNSFARMWLHPFFVLLSMNASLKKVDVNGLSLADETVCGALREVFSKNSVLEELTLSCEGRLNDTDVASWRRTLPFLRDNKTLKSFAITFVGEKWATFCLDTVAVLKDNVTLECLDIRKHRTDASLSLDIYFTALESLQWNTTLKKLLLHPNLESIGKDEMNLLISIIKKNYGLETLEEEWFEHDTTGELRTILRLNGAGRRYLKEDAGSIAKGVEALVAVRDDLDCLFYHLLENPLLCDMERRYVSDSPVHSNKRQRTSK